MLSGGKPPFPSCEFSQVDPLRLEEAVFKRRGLQKERFSKTEWFANTTEFLSALEGVRGCYFFRGDGNDCAHQKPEDECDLAVAKVIVYQRTGNEAGD